MIFRDPLFIAELNRQRSEMWSEAKARMKSLANRALDVVELQLGSGDPKAALAAARYVLQGTQLLGETKVNIGGPTTPAGVILEDLRIEARREPAPKVDLRDPFDLDLSGTHKFEEDIEALAQSRLKKAMAEAGLS